MLERVSEPFKTVHDIRLLKDVHSRLNLKATFPRHELFLARVSLARLYGCECDGSFSKRHDIPVRRNWELVSSARSGGNPK